MEMENDMMHELKDIMVWKTLDGVITITSCLDNLLLAKVVNHHIDWEHKELCCPDVIAYVEEKA